MVAYVIAIREETTDPAKLAEYVPKGTAAFAGRDFTVLAAYGRTEVLEGAPAEAVAIIQFPTFADARDWYDSPLNQQAIAYRLAGARFRMMIVEGS